MKNVSLMKMLNLESNELIKMHFSAYFKEELRGRQIMLCVCWNQDIIIHLNF